VQPRLQDVPRPLPAQARPLRGRDDVRHLQATGGRPPPAREDHAAGSRRSAARARPLPHDRVCVSPLDPHGLQHERHLPSSPSGRASRAHAPRLAERLRRRSDPRHVRGYPPRLELRAGVRERAGPHGGDAASPRREAHRLPRLRRHAPQRRGAARSRSPRRTVGSRSPLRPEPFALVQRHRAGRLVWRDSRLRRRRGIVGRGGPPRGRVCVCRRPEGRRRTRRRTAAAAAPGASGPAA
jgi:hypothetical protein